MKTKHKKARCRECGWVWKRRVVNPIKCPNPKCQAFFPLMPKENDK